MKSDRPKRRRREVPLPKAMLTVAGPDRVDEVLLERSGVVIGRSPQCQVVLADERVSRQHAHIFQDPFGRWIIEDLGSRTGVLLSGQRVQAHALLPGEKIAIGPFALCLSLPPEPDIPADPAESSTTSLISEAADLDVVRQGTAPGAVLPRVWLQELNRIADRLAELQSPAELYPAVCECLATAPGTAALVIRLPPVPAPLPSSPEVLVSRLGGEPAAKCLPEGVNLHLSRRVLEAVRTAGEPILARSVHGAEGQVTLTIGDERTPRAVLCAPVTHRRGAMDALYVDVPFSESIGEVFEFVQAVAGQVRLVRKSLLMLDWRAKRSVLDHQLSLAREIQAKLTPKKLARVPGVDVALYYRPALWVGGDYCDVWQLADKRLAYAVGDVCGKGLPAALVMANLQAALRTATSFCPRPSEAIAHVNDHLRRHLPEDMFVSLFFGLFDPSSGAVEYVNAGHIPPWIVGPRGAVTSLDSPRDTILGVSGGQFSAAVATIAPGQALLSVTDGITEAMSAGGQQFGAHRLEELLRGVDFASSQEVVRAVLKATARFRGNQAQHDDVTVLVLLRQDIPTGTS